MIGLFSLCLWGCDVGPRAKQAKDGDQAEDRSELPKRRLETPSARPSDRAEAQEAEVWSANRKYSAEENAHYHYKRDGKALGAKSYEDFLRLTHDFVTHPPKGAKTLTRKNGDTLIYDPKANIFAVATKDGVPRTIFKPDDGADYWQEQVDRPDRSRPKRTRRSDDG